MLATLQRLFGGGQPDGVAEGVEEDALAAGGAIADDIAPPPPAAPKPESVVLEALGQKVLHAWLQNRHQTRYPLVLNLRNNTPDEVGLVLRAVRRSLALVDPSEEAFARAAEFIGKIGGALDRETGPPVHDLVGRLHEARLASEAYAACAGALGRRGVAARRYLDFLAARLEVPDEVARSINRRFAH